MYTMQIKRINATRARNEFFNLLKESVLEKQTFIIEKGEIPMVYMVPVSEIGLDRNLNYGSNDMMQLLKRLKRFRSSMKMTSDSVKLLREARRYGK